MKRLYVTLGLIALVALFSLPGAGQMGQRPLADNANPSGMQGAQAQIQLLAAINRAGLSLEQMETIQSALQSVLAARDELVAVQQSVKDFLISWNGAGADFDADYAQARAPLDQAVQALKDQAQAALEVVKNTLTVSQGQILKSSLGLGGGAGRMHGPGSNQERMQARPGPSGRRQSDMGQAGVQRGGKGRGQAQADAGAGGMRQGMMARGTDQGQATSASYGNLNWLVRVAWVSQVLEEKIAALKNP